MIISPNYRPLVQDAGADGADLRKIALAWLVFGSTSDRHQPVWLDAATGAGNMTLRAARRLRSIGGRLISVDIDPESWEAWARPKLEAEGLTDIVQFLHWDLRDLEGFPFQVDAIISDMTLSTMGLEAIDAIGEWRKILRRDGRVVVYDYLPQSEARCEAEEIANQAWRLYKAAAVLSGHAHYEEFAPDFVQRLLLRQGFCLEKTYIDHERPNRSQESLDEWEATSLNLFDIPDESLRTAFSSADADLRRRVSVHGSLPRWSGTYLILASNIAPSESADHIGAASGSGS